MIKYIIKESFIIILLIVVLALVLGIIFYEYIPMNKIIPTKVEAYTISDELEKELGQIIIDSNQETITKTYVVEEYELQQYEKNDEYDKGKKNPFSAIGEEPVTVPTTEPSQNEITDKQPNINTTK